MTGNSRLHARELTVVQALADRTLDKLVNEAAGSSTGGIHRKPAKPERRCRLVTSLALGNPIACMKQPS
jgi:hypothetical protein